jgi:hypothetical protein
VIQGTIKQFYQEHQVPNPINITLTQKQVVDGQRIDDETSSANFRHFRNLLNRRLFGNAHKRYGRQLSMLVVREDGAWHRHHIHAIIEKPAALRAKSIA